MPSLAPHTGVLGIRLASHLLRRATYAINKDLIYEFAALTPQAALDQLLTIQAHAMPEPLDHATGEMFCNAGSQPTSSGFYLQSNIRSWWMEEAVQDESIGHKLEFFLHTILVSRIDGSNDTAAVAYDYLNLFRLTSSRHSSGTVDMDSYKDLAYKMCTDNLMLRYLDGSYNHKWAPNENFAREFLELFTIGRGEQIAPGDYTNYTEDDIQSAARLLTGWRDQFRPYAQAGGDPLYTDPETGLQQGFADFERHDTEAKQFSSAFNNAVIQGAQDHNAMWVELRQFVEMVFNQDETARNLCRRLYRYFVHDHISEEVETGIILPLATIFKSNNYRLSVAIRSLLESQHFYDLDDASASDNIVGSLIKNPMELLLGTMSFFDIQRPDIFGDTVNHYEIWYNYFVYFSILEPAGMELFDPPSVAGYGGYHQAPNYSKNWFNSATLISRYKLPENLTIAAEWNGGVALDIVDFVANSGIVSNPADGQALVSELIGCLFCESPSPERTTYFLNDVFLDGLSLLNWQFEWQGYENSGDDSSVKIPLRALFNAMISSQEYGCM